MAKFSLENIKYFKQVLSLFLVKLPSDEMIKKYFTSDDCGLQDFVGMNLKNDFNWSTSIGIIEAAESIVKEAENNSNIDYYGE